jgi:hypothetical protein
MIWKVYESSILVTIRRYCHDFLEVLRKTTKRLRHDSRSLHRDLKPECRIRSRNANHSSATFGTLPSDVMSSCGPVTDVELRQAKYYNCWSRLPPGLRRRSADSWLLGSRVRIRLRAWMFVLCLYVVLSCVGRGLMQWADHSSRGVLPCVSNSLWLRNLIRGG